MASAVNELERLTGRGIQVVKAKIGLFSNNQSLIYAPEYFEGVRHPSVSRGEGWLIHSLNANFQVSPTDYQQLSELDGYFYIFDYKGAKPNIVVSEDHILATGDWSRLEKEAVDKRYTLLGNQGLLFRFILTILERKHHIYNFHACALYDEGSNEMLLVLGERGSGKSALLLSALDKGLFKLFATEIVHVGITDEGITFYKGTLRNNVRAGHLLYDFPGVAENIGLKLSSLEDPWGTKIQVNLGKYGTKSDIIVNPEITIVIPRIEEHNELCQYHYIKNMRKMKLTLMDNICDKIRSLPLIYEAIPVNALDDPILTMERLRFVEKFLERGNIKRVVSLFASPKNCFEGWL